MTRKPALTKHVLAALAACVDRAADDLATWESAIPEGDPYTERESLRNGWKNVERASAWLTKRGSV